MANVFILWMFCRTLNCKSCIILCVSRYIAYYYCYYTGLLNCYVLPLSQKLFLLKGQQCMLLLKMRGDTNTIEFVSLKYTLEL